MRCTSLRSSMVSCSISSRSLPAAAGSTNSVPPLAERSTTVPGTFARCSRRTASTHRPWRWVIKVSMKYSGWPRSSASSRPWIRCRACSSFRRRLYSWGLARSCSSSPAKQRSSSSYTGRSGSIVAPQAASVGATASIRLRYVRILSHPSKNFPQAISWAGESRAWVCRAPSASAKPSWEGRGGLPAASIAAASPVRSRRASIRARSAKGRVAKSSSLAASQAAPAASRSNIRSNSSIFRVCSNFYSSNIRRFAGDGPVRLPLGRFHTVALALAYCHPLNRAGRAVRMAG